MATYHTVDGQSYSVTADGAEVTVSNASGLNQTVKAGTQYSFVGNGGDVTVAGPHHFVQLKAPFGSGVGNGGGGGQKITVDDYVDHTYTSENPVQNKVLAQELDGKQGRLTFDDYPKYMSGNPVKSSGLYPTPYNVVRNGVISFDESPDPMDPDNPKCFMHPNTLYIVWDNDLDDRSVVAVLPDNLMPDYFSTVELHIFNHQSTPISLKWPAGWHWYDAASDSYKKDADGHVYSPVLTGNSCMCIVVRCSVFGSTHFEPTVTVDPFVMAKVAYVHQMHDEDPVEKV